MDVFKLYFDLGWQHISDLGGYDHILFVTVLCGIYALSEWKTVLWLVTAFTVGHSIALALSVLNIVNVNPDFIEFLIPLSIVLTALSNLMNKKSSLQKQKYIIASFFGVIHGLGFSNYLRSLLGQESDLIMPLLSFNLGLEFGQILIVFIVLAIAQIMMKIFKVSKRDWNMFLSSAVFGVAFIMCLERLGNLI